MNLLADCVTIVTIITITTSISSCATRKNTSASVETNFVRIYCASNIKFQILNEKSRTFDIEMNHKLQTIHTLRTQYTHNLAYFRCYRCCRVEYSYDMEQKQKII